MGLDQYAGTETKFSGNDVSFISGSKPEISPNHPSPIQKGEEAKSNTKAGNSGSTGKPVRKWRGTKTQHGAYSQRGKHTDLNRQRMKR